MEDRPLRQDRTAPDGAFRRLVGRAAGGLYVVGGVIAAGEALTMSGREHRVVLIVLAVGAVGVVAGVVMLRLPWERLPRRASLWAVAPAMGLIGLGNWIDPDPYLAAVFLLLLAMWLGMAQPRGTVLAFSPLFALTYWWPMSIVAHAPGLARSVPYVIGLCVLAGEWLAWLTAQLHAAQRRLRDHDQRRFQALLAAASDTTVVLNAAGEVTYVSPTESRGIPLPVHRLSGQGVGAYVDQHVHPDDAAALRVTLSRLLLNNGSEHTVQFRLAQPLGGWCNVEAVGRNLLDDEAIHGVLMNLRDVSERTRLQDELTEQAFADQLTGLPNRTLLRDRAESALALAGRDGCSAALLLIDLDRFKEINDTLGHHQGDLLLQEMARRLRAVVRDSDTVARLGGDEFAVLLPRVATVEDATAVAGKLRTVIEAPFVVEGVTMDIDASVGLAVFPQHAGDPDELLQRAELAMYAAKTAHLDCVVYGTHLDVNSPRRLGLLGEMRRAIANDEFVVHYQPQADARTGQVTGLEALVRWRHPEQGLLGPGEFIPLAETTGLIRPLTSYVLATALRECQSLRDAGHDLSIAINVSARCLLDHELLGDVARTLDECAVPADRLVLEITESTLMIDPVRATEVLNRLHELGARLSIDDFGTGYSSMAYLNNLPVDELKVDRSFVTDMCDQPTGHEIVRSTIDLAHNLGLRVVAEGVENEQTAQELVHLSCDLIQGYHLARPMSGARLLPWLAQRATERGTPRAGGREHAPAGHEATEELGAA